jgi:hypothetical protein
MGQSKNKPVTIGSILNVEDVNAWFYDNPVEPTRAEEFFPLDQNLKGLTWKTISNQTSYSNEAADPISSKSSVPVSGREGFQDIIGEMTEFGKGYEWDADEIEKFNKLVQDFATLGNQAAAQRLINYYGNDLAKIRNAMRVQMSYMDWAVISDACQFGFLASNSPFYQGLTTMQYPVQSWQKNEVATSWSDPAALILDDIQSVLDTGETYGKRYLDIIINKKWFNYVRQNDQIKTQTISLVSSLVGAENNPNLETINNMLSSYFDVAVKFVVIDETVTRADLNDTKSVANPFKDGVAVFSQGGTLGRFEWNALPITDSTIETAESFMTIGNYVKVDPNYAKFYGKGRGFPVIDTYRDNFYLKVDAVAWP